MGFARTAAAIAVVVSLFANSLGDSPAFANSDADVAKAQELLEQRQHLAAFDLARRTYSEIAVRGFDFKSLAPKTAVLLGEVLNRAGDYVSASNLSKKFLKSERGRSASGLDVVRAVANNLLHASLELGRYQDAGLQARSLLSEYRLANDGDATFARSIGLLADYCIKTALSCPFEAMYRKSLAIFIRELGSRHLDAERMTLRLATILNASGAKQDAKDLAASIQNPANDPDLEAGELEFAADQLAFGVVITPASMRPPRPLYERAVEIRETRLGMDHPSLVRPLTRLGESIYPNLDLGRDFQAKAHDLLTRAITITQRTESFSRDRLDQALKSRRRTSQRSLYGSNDGKWLGLEADNLIAQFRDYQREFVLGGDPTAAKRISKSRSAFSDLAKSLLIGLRNDEPSEKAFLVAQWALKSFAQTALAQLETRYVSQKPGAAVDIRQRQDLFGERRRVEEHVFAAWFGEAQSIEAEAGNLKRLREIDGVLAPPPQAAEEPVDAKSDAAALDEPLAVADVQALLRDDEAMTVILPSVGVETDKVTLVWVVTKSTFDMTRWGISATDLAKYVDKLRCGLDRSAWQSELSWRCRQALGASVPVPSPESELPFDRELAHTLYNKLFGKFDSTLKDKHLFVVTSNPLSKLPFGVLLARAPGKPRPNEAEAVPEWLGTRQPISMLPAVSSLRVLRQTVKPSQAAEPYIGFGNPVLTGACDPVAIPDKCPQDDAVATLASLPGRRSAASNSRTPLSRNGLALVAEVRALCPLPDTAHELYCVAKSLETSVRNVHAGPAMTETAVKSLPLETYRILHFATHGLLGGESAQLAQGLNEPALVMTPPDVATVADDGLLTSSEISLLRLDADWVILSACNTAAGNEDEMLSGLASAFLYAGARTLLVSHWPVDSYAATMLTSRTFAELQAEPGMGRAEAFRRAMLALMSDSSRPWVAHPSFWAPFVVVGESGPVIR